MDVINNYLSNNGVSRDEVLAAIRCYLNDPVEFIEPSYSFSVRENATATVPIGTVRSTGTIGTASYSITEGNYSGRFATTARGGIKVVSPLDHESRPTHALTVRVTDATGRWDETTVYVNVSNVEEAPEFDLDTYRFAIPLSVRSTSTEPVPVGAIRAEDPDGDDVVSYSISSGNTSSAGCPESSLFTVDGLGVVYVCPASLPTTARDYSRLIVTASDDSSNTDTTRVSVKYTALPIVDNFLRRRASGRALLP